MQIVNVSEEDQLRLKMLSRNSYEVNGQIKVSVDGKIENIEHQRGQIMKPCFNGCLLNYHTHPPDYETLYPDHPSATDFKYIYNATCRFKELSGHLVVTPKFLYFIKYNCQNLPMQIYDFFTITFRIDKRFNDLAINYDRSTEAFRQAYMVEMRKIGFDVRRFSWGSDISFHVSKSNGTFYKIIVVIVMMFLFVRFFA
tara:strand:+ start:7522 stop:8115 length:594 start_codon:yes stop_codon:yes gene_type:complete